MTSRISKCRGLNQKDRLEYLTDFIGLSQEEAKLFTSSEQLNLETADRMIENVVGFMPIPLGIAEGLIVNGREYLVPIATEQRSVISMVTKGAELTRAEGGFKANTVPPLMIGQIQLLNVPDFQMARQNILTNKESILKEANTQSGSGKAVDVKVRSVKSPFGSMLIVELLVNVRDSMGANIVDSMCEAVAPLIKRLSSGQVNVKVVSDLVGPCSD